MTPTTTGLAITALTEADRPRWTELWRGYLDFYETVLPDAIYDHTWSRLMAGAEIHGLAARKDGEIIGITHYLFHAHCWSLGPACYLQDLYVDAAIRGAGAGRALIETVADKARAAGATRLYWTTQDNNATARALYDRLAKYRGFIKYDYPPL
jgi:GNAT superfamily N-acetyltransferase